MNLKIAPSILSADFSKLGEAVSFLDSSQADYIHLDIMDGHFVPNITIGPNVIKSIRHCSSKVFDVHLMISAPSEHLDAFIEAGSDIISIHHEIKEEKITLLQKIRQKGLRSGVVFNPDSDLSLAKAYFPFVDQILLMSVFPGFGGQSFILESLKRGKYIRDLLIQEGYEHVDLEIDGGIKLENSQKVVDAGYNVLVAGSGIFNTESPASTIERMKLLNVPVD